MALIWVNQIKGGEIHEETIGGIDIKRGYGSGYAVWMRGIWFWFRRGYVIENGQITVSGTAEELLNNDEVKKAYLGF